MPFVRVDSAEDAVAYCAADLLWFKWNADTEYYRQESFGKGKLAGFENPDDLVHVWRKDRKTVPHYDSRGGNRPGWEFYVLVED